MAHIRHFYQLTLREAEEHTHQTIGYQLLTEGRVPNYLRKYDKPVATTVALRGGMKRTQLAGTELKNN
jgi:hypothetical protein